MNLIQSFLRGGVIFRLITVCLFGCGPTTPSVSDGDQDIVGEEDQLILPYEGALVIKAQARFSIQVEKGSSNPTLLRSSRVQERGKGINIVNVASTIMVVDDSNWVVPAISNSLLDFGYLQVSQLSDNNLRVCGPNRRKKCKRASIRMYTIDQEGAGLWNTDDQYGVPILGGIQGMSLSPIGLNVDGAVIVQTFEIPSGKNVLKKEDFVSDLKYNVQVDFNNAGAGTYVATLILEYILTL